MSLVVPSVSDVRMLQYIVNAIGQGGGSAPSAGQNVLRLYTNNLTPGKTTVIGNITEATQTGYSPITLLGTSWTVNTTAGVSAATYAQQTFTFTEAVSVFGYFVTTSEITPSLLWVERIPEAPYTLPNGGGEIQITPYFTLN